MVNVPQVLVGTNTLDALYSSYLQKETVSPNLVSNGYTAVLKTLDVKHRQSCAETLGCVTLKGTVPETVSAGSTAVLDLSYLPSEKLTVISPPTISSLPGGLLVASAHLT